MLFVVSAAALACDTCGCKSKRSLGEDAKTAGRVTVNYTGNVANESVNIVGRAAKGTGETAVSPFKKLWNWMTGKGEGSEVVTAPITKAGVTVRDTTVDTVKLPVTAGEKTASQQ